MVHSESIEMTAEEVMILILENAEREAAARLVRCKGRISHAQHEYDCAQADYARMSQRLALARENYVRRAM